MVPSSGREPNVSSLGSFLVTLRTRPVRADSYIQKQQSIGLTTCFSLKGYRKRFDHILMWFALHSKGNVFFQNEAYTTVTLFKKVRK